MSYAMDFDNIPAIPPPPGVVSNFNNPKTLKGSLIAVNAIFLSSTLIAVVIRLYSRGFIVRALGWDDYTCVMAAVASIVHTFMILYSIGFGYGTHLWDIRAITLIPSHVRPADALSIAYIFAIFFIKLSICLLYLRIFGVRRNFKLFVYGSIIFCALFYTAYLGTSIAVTVECASPSALTLPICTHAIIITIVTSVINVCTDVYLLVLPIYPILNLKLHQRRKIGLLLVFLSGLVACAVSIARLIYTSVRIHSADTLYYAALTTEFSIVELNVAIITSSMSAMPQFFSKSKLFQASTYSSLRARLFHGRSGTPIIGISHLSRTSKSSKSTPQKDDYTRDNEYLQLQEIPIAHIENDHNISFSGDDDSRQEMLKKSYTT